MQNPNSEILESLNWRYAAKRFDPTKKVSDADWKVLAETLRLTPSSYGLQPWQFILVQNTELREKLKVAAFNQTQVTDCSHFVVLTYLKKLDHAHVQKNVEQMAKVRNIEVSALEGFKKVCVDNLIDGPRSKTIDQWAQRQCYIAMGMIMESAALLKIDTCPMEGLSASEFDRILGLENTAYATIAAVAVGYRHPDDKYSTTKKVRFDADDVIRVIK